MNTPITATIITSVQVTILLLLSGSKSNDRYPKYAMIPNVAARKIIPICALLPVNTAAKPTTNTNTSGIPNRLPNWSMPNEGGAYIDAADFIAISDGYPFGMLPSWQFVDDDALHVIVTGSPSTVIGGYSNVGWMYIEI